MDHIAAAEEQFVSERIRRKLEEVNASAQSQLSPIQDHINFTLQVFTVICFCTNPASRTWNFMLRMCLCVLVHFGSEEQFTNSEKIAKKSQISLEYCSIL